MIYRPNDHSLRKTGRLDHSRPLLLEVTTYNSLTRGPGAAYRGLHRPHVHAYIYLRQ